jgi:hypothetical protein
MPKIIQFLHPNTEAEPIHPNDKIIPWNNNKTHRRKYLVSTGKYLDNNYQLVKNELAFWGEWEAQSEIIKINKSKSGAPNYFNFPFLDPSVPEKTHTTDPYVFGNNFKYFICRQSKNHHILKNLEPGSIILFGSCINFKFCLDTLFVVSKNWFNYNTSNIETHFPKNKRGRFYHTCMDPIFGSAQYNTNVDEEDNCRINKGETFVCYDGVNFEEKENYNGMYSFVPSKIYNNENPNTSIFVQPVINLDKIINHEQTMGIKSEDESDQEIKEFWNKIIEQIKNNNLLQGVYFNSPPLKNKLS